MTADSYGPKKQPRFSGSGSPDTAADNTEISDYAAETGNRIAGTTADFNALTAADVWPGLEFYNLDTNLVSVLRSNGSWYRLGGGLFRGTRDGQKVGSASLSTLGPFTRVPGMSSRDDFVTGVSSTAVSLTQGEYVVGVQYSTGGPTITGRSFLGVSCNGFTARGYAGAGEDTWSVGMPFTVGASGAGLSVQLYQTSGVDISGTASLSIVRVG